MFQLALALLTVYSVLVKACYGPFNDVRFMKSTFVTEWAANSNPHPETNWTTVVIGDTSHLSWPMQEKAPTDLPGPQGLVTVPYCYKT
ncbi:hypothetical protein EK21DRAFT_110067 [Setomelanomma holmii]|uniref:Uncharacterized protein n=1 Tax=Setomelanomma holmii TaxID=210430 RepID=A0A9P4HEY2_9PLEO|nr:hypothetical protein EK21DRAFT_110067 [Setomelanomma holmii]